LRALVAVPGLRALLQRVLGPSDPILRVHVFGRELPGPLGLAAGFDKDAKGVGALLALGFGFVEVGTVTAEAQPGNARPRMFRLRRDRALINRLGFNNDGAAAAARRLAHRRAGTIGINIGKTKRVAEEAALADYARSAEALAPLADYLVVNVSSPNTPGLRNWQSPEKITELFAGMLGKAGESPCPVLLKLSPDLERNDLFRICDVALELGVDGIVACNTSIAREALGVTSPHPGGLSGRPLLIRAREQIRDIHTHTSGKIPIVGVGGVATAEDAWLHIRAGASIVELYTALIYEGPGVAERIESGLADLLRRAGFRSISEAVGIDR
jgi:dihydroorotate dehydrogenase